MAWVSYAQALEDIHLMRALSRVNHEDGFYVDVGAWHPEIDSVTKLFYDAGWRGINIEPSPIRFPAFPEQRPRDINLQIAITETPGEIAFYDDPNGGLGTLIGDIAAGHGDGMRQVTVEGDTLSHIWEQHVGGRDVHFLKVDVEGAETAALRSLDLTRHRPWVMCIESHYPLRTDIQLYDLWEPYLIAGGYSFVYADPWRINRYYVAEERKECRAGFAVPADFYVHARNVAELEVLRTKIAAITQIVAP